MVNIPTDLLRTLISVVDFRSHTKAAQFLGMTQPAVSTQIKRLQELLGAEIFDKSAPGIKLTTKGEIVAAHARRILSINDKLVHLASPKPPVDALRIGVPSEFARRALDPVFGELRPLAGTAFSHPVRYLRRIAVRHGRWRDRCGDCADRRDAGA